MRNARLRGTGPAWGQSSDGKHVLCPTKGTRALWLGTTDLETGAEFVMPNATRATIAAIAPYGAKAALATEDGQVFVLATSTGEQVEHLSCAPRLADLR